MVFVRPVDAVGRMFEPLLYEAFAKSGDVSEGVSIIVSSDVSTTVVAAREMFHEDRACVAIPVSVNDFGWHVGPQMKSDGPCMRCIASALWPGLMPSTPGLVEAPGLVTLGLRGSVQRFFVECRASTMVMARLAPFEFAAVDVFSDPTCAECGDCI